MIYRNTTISFQKTITPTYYCYNLQNDCYTKPKDYYSRFKSTITNNRAMQKYFLGILVAYNNYHIFGTKSLQVYGIKQERDKELYRYKISCCLSNKNNDI